MIWLFNGIELYDRFTINKKVNENNNTYYTFRWKHPKRTLVFCKKEIYLDLGIDCIFQIKKMYTEPCRGWGIVYSHADFCKKFGLNTN
jgi:hypothetical protein